MPDLSSREQELLRAVANGDSYRQLARQWGVEEVTVRWHGHRLLAKLGANSIAHAVFLACRAGILDGRPRRHGDHAGYAAHLYRGEEPCEACRVGERAYRNGRRSPAQRPVAATGSGAGVGSHSGGDAPSRLSSGP